MKYQVKEIQENIWNEFVLSQSNTLFVQSSAYGEFYKKQGEQAWLFGVYDETGELITGSLVVSTHAKRGNFLYLPYGPVGDCHNFEAWKVFFDFLKIFGKKEGYGFIRFSPFCEETKENIRFLHSLGSRLAPIHMLAETTWLLDITPTSDELKMAMAKNHRNLINRCERDGVRVEMRTDFEALQKFNEMHDQTASKHNFHRFSKDYINNEFSSFVKQGSAVVFLGYLPDGRLDAASVIIYFGSMASYRHAASLAQDKRLPVSYALQWASILEAKKRGMGVYNFWGIAPDGSSKSHPFYGITHYKKGFGGLQKDLMRCHDIPLSVSYYLTWIIETIRSKKRGFS